MTQVSSTQAVPTGSRTQTAFNELLAALILAALGLAWLMSLWNLAGGTLAWTILRATGTVAYLSLAVTTSFGALLASRYAPGWLNRAAQYGWHGILSGFALVVSTVHGVFLAVDGQYRQPITAIIVPGTSGFKPLEIGMGTLAVYLMLVVYGSTALRSRLSPRVWRVLHMLSYPAFVLSTLHAWRTGSDPLAPLYIASSAAVLLTFSLRMFEERNRLKARA
jgi:methionine sulfoxide reductase heme-binding subunit